MPCVKRRFRPRSYSSHHVLIARSVAGGGIVRWSAPVLALMVLGVVTLLPKGAFAANDSAQVEFFEAKIRPVLSKHCYPCHSKTTGKAEGSLHLDSRQGIRAGGDRGPAVVPGKPEESLLLTAISHTDPDLKMPPKGKRLPDAVIGDFEVWIRAGAVDPRDSAAPAQDAAIRMESAKSSWAFQPPASPQLPHIQNTAWAKRGVDYFVAARLEEAKLEPSADAAPHTLLRRLHFDLTGLPPDLGSIRRFGEQVRQQGLDAALAAEVDALLASPHYGERWGRHWLDVARFAESSGKEANISFPYAWRYRDYVIDAFNADLPYNRFLLEQLAGDLLPYENPQERATLLIATGFLALGPKNLDEANPLQFAADLVDEQLDTVTRAIIASSVACARCHDHKFEPYSLEDYYALAGIFGSTQTFFGTAVSPSNRMAGDPLPLPREAGHAVFHADIPAARVAQLKQDLAKLKQQEEDGLAAVLKAIQSGDDPEKYFTITDALRIFWTSGNIEGQLEKVDALGKALPLAMGVLDRDKPANAPLLAQGDIDRPGEPVPRRFPEVFSIEHTEPIPSDQSGRLQLARWLTHPQHPLTARVMANRIWLHLFGAGLAASADNFGMSSDPPSHPELLDYLACRLVDEGWSVKQLIREIVLSRAYRQSSAFREPAFQTDPENRLLWRMSKRRLEAESIRDAMLSASDQLDPNRPLGSLVARQIGDRPISLIGLDPKIPRDLDGSLHRSVYLPVLRDRLPDVLDLFDFAEPSLVTGHRESTNVPVQALYLMNSPFVQAQSVAFAHRLLRQSDNNADRIRLAFQLSFARAPDDDEMEMATKFLGTATLPSDQVLGKPADWNVPTQKLVSFCQALLSTAEFRNLD